MNNFFYKTHGLKKISSLLLLFVFILGITPKKTLHNWFANHKDSTYPIPAGETQQISTAGFNCVCDDLVAESHFITFGAVVVVNTPPVNRFLSFFIPSFVSLSFFHNNLRGPPLKF
jgi:hypothetical protein